MVSRKEVHEAVEELTFNDGWRPSGCMVVRRLIVEHVRVGIGGEGCHEVL
jgi:hypothetical protein